MDKKTKSLPTEIPYRPRLSVELSFDQKERLNALIPWGMLKTIISTIIDQLIEALEENTSEVLAAIFAKEITVKDLIGLNKKEEKEGKQDDS